MDILKKLYNKNLLTLQQFKYCKKLNNTEKIISYIIRFKIRERYLKNDNLIHKIDFYSDNKKVLRAFKKNLKDFVKIINFCKIEETKVYLVLSPELPLWMFLFIKERTEANKFKEKEIRKFLDPWVKYLISQMNEQLNIEKPEENSYDFIFIGNKFLGIKIYLTYTLEWLLNYV